MGGKGPAFSCAHNQLVNDERPTEEQGIQDGSQAEENLRGDAEVSQAKEEELPGDRTKGSLGG